MSELFLIISLFLPRWSLLVAYITGGIPGNPVPFFADFLLTVFVPRLLILIYIYGTLGIESAWFWVHLIVAAIVYLGGVRTRYSGD